MKITTFSFCLLLTVLFCSTGCVTGRNPLEGWKERQTARADCPFDKTICDDYRSYLDSLSPGDRSTVDDFSITFYEDGRGQRAVTIHVLKNNSSREHVLIYDANNKRTKVIKYTSGWFVH